MSEHETATVRQNPRRKGEAFWSYLEHLAVLLGHMQPEQAQRHAAGTEWSSAGEALDVVESDPWWTK